MWYIQSCSLSIILMYWTRYCVGVVCLVQTKSSCVYNLEPFRSKEPNGSKERFMAGITRYAPAPPAIPGGRPLGTGKGSPSRPPLSLYLYHVSACRWKRPNAKICTLSRTARWKKKKKAFWITCIFWFIFSLFLLFLSKSLHWTFLFQVLVPAKLLSPLPPPFL